MIEYIPLAISSLNAAKDIASGLLHLRDFDKITSATMELKGHLVQTYDHIISEKERVLVLQSQISELKKECVRLKDWSAEKEKYECRQIAHGVFVQIDKTCQGNFEQAHKLCCNCFNKTIKATLQQSTEFKPHVGRIKTLTCPNGCPALEFSDYIKQT